MDSGPQQHSTKKGSMNTQKIVSDLKLAALLKYMGYPCTVKVDNLGTQWLFQDPGDLQEAIDAYASGAQVADSQKLLQAYESLSGQYGSGQSAPQAEEFAPVNGTQVTRSRNFAVMSVWHMFGLDLHLVPNSDGKVEGVVQDGGTAKNLLMRFKNGQLNGNLADFDKSLYAVRALVKSAQRPQAQPERKAA
jgi:hypothetical protein